MRDDKYFFPEGAEGTGKDISWCGRERGGKRCLLCANHAKYEEWSQTWNWYYLLDWHDDSISSRPGKKYWYAHCRANWQCHKNMRSTGRRGWWGSSWSTQPNPIRYSSRGLGFKEFRSLLKRGCRKNKKCKCMSLIQRGNWYCPDCYKAVYMMASYKDMHPHDIMIMNREELKMELLTLRLSGVL